MAKQKRPAQNRGAIKVGLEVFLLPGGRADANSLLYLTVSRYKSETSIGAGVGGLSRRAAVGSRHARLLPRLQG